MAAVEKTEDTYTYTCPDCEFKSGGWSTKSVATERGKQHAREHESGKPMQDLHKFEESK